MAQARKPKTVVSCVVLAFIATLIIHALPLLGQAPTFLPPVTYGSGGYVPVSLALGDLNGDGILDIVVANQCVVGDTCPNGNSYTCFTTDYCSHGAVGVLLGNGDGTFRPAATYETTGYFAVSVALADLSGNGVLDVVVVNACGTIPDSDDNCPYGTVDVMFGNGDGTFGPPMTYVMNGWYPVSVALGDLNGDGKPDIVVADICVTQSICPPDHACSCPTGSAEVLLNSGDGVFYSPTVFESGAPWAYSVALGKLSRDGKLDVVVANSGSVGVLLGNGDGTLKPAVNYGSGGGPESVTVGDANADGIPDLLVAQAFGIPGSQSGTVGVLLGNGDGTFKPAQVYPSGGVFARSVTVADVNGDGRPDLVVTNLGGNPPDYFSLNVLVGNGDGTFGPALSFDSGNAGTFGAVAGDLNNDGRPDLVVIGQGGLGVNVLLNSTYYGSATRITSSSARSFAHQPVTFTATVTPRPLPDGQIVMFYDGTTLIGSGSLAGGIATFTTSSLSAKTHSIEAAYKGDAFEQPSSASVMQVVNGYPSTTTLMSSLNPSIYGQRISWTAKVTSGAVPPTGTVAFRWGEYTIGKATLDGSGVAILSRSNLNADPYPLTAVYQGDAAHLGSTSPVLNQTVLQTTSAATLVSSANPSTVGQGVTFTVTITSPTVTAMGPVTFTLGKTSLGTAQLSGKKATFTTSSLPAGSNPIKVTYNGDSNIAGSSAVITQIVQP